MSSLYLSMRAGDATPGRTLRFERGRPIAEFSLGRCGTWRTSAAGISDRHLWIRFDGQCFVLRRDAASPPVSVDGQPLAFVAEPIARLPCHIELGTLRLIIGDQAPPAPAFEARALAREAELARALLLRPRAFDPVGLAKQGAVPFTVATMAGGFVPARSGALVSAEDERSLGDGHATSVMPLDVMLRRGLIPAPNAREPQAAPQRRRRPLEARRGAAAIAARAAAQLARWCSALEPRRWLRARAKPRLAWMLLVPVFPVLGYALRADSPADSASSASFTTTAWATSQEARSEGEARRRSAATDPSARASTQRGGATLGRDEQLGSSVAADVDVDGAVDVALPASDARTGATGERLAVDALAAGDRARARALYAALASQASDNAAFAEAARILSLDRSAAQRAAGR